MPNCKSCGTEIEWIKTNMEGGEMSKIYEARETTNDEMYYPLGFYTDLDGLLNEIMGCKDPNDIVTGYNDSDYGVSIEIWEYEINTFDDGKMIREYHWSNIYNEDNDEYEWGKATLVNNRKIKSQ